VLHHSGQFLKLQRSITHLANTGEVSLDLVNAKSETELTLILDSPPGPHQLGLNRIQYRQERKAYISKRDIIAESIFLYKSEAGAAESILEYCRGQVLLVTSTSCYKQENICCQDHPIKNKINKYC
jgi:hypothetical protein